jgi:UDP-N-acetyl-D-mannosaminuronic acid dehydrogenase
VAVLGFSYLENSDDTRNSPSEVLASRLRAMGYEVVIHDPFVEAYRGEVADALKGSDCAVLMVAHSAYRQLDLATAAKLMRHPRLIDARGFFRTEDLQTAGFEHRVIGVGTKFGG